MTPFEKALYQEHLNMRLIDKAVQTAVVSLKKEKITEDEALKIIISIRQEILRICPGHEREFELIIEPRLVRLMQCNPWVWVDRVVAPYEGREVSE